MISKNTLLLKLAEYINTDEFLGDTAFWVTNVQIQEDGVVFLINDDYEESVWHTIKIEANT